MKKTTTTKKNKKKKNNGMKKKENTRIMRVIGWVISTLALVALYWMQTQPTNRHISFFFFKPLSTHFLLSAFCFAFFFCFTLFWKSHFTSQLYSIYIYIHIYWHSPPLSLSFSFSLSLSVRILSYILLRFFFVCKIWLFLSSFLWILSLMFVFRIISKTLFFVYSVFHSPTFFFSQSLSPFLFLD